MKVLIIVRPVIKFPKRDTKLKGSNKRTNSLVHRQPQKDLHRRPSDANGSYAAHSEDLKDCWYTVLSGVQLA